MDQQSLRKALKYKLRPTAEQERERERVLLLCRTLDNAALDQRSTAWQRCQVSVSRSQQEAELKDIRAELPEDAALPSHLLQEVLARLDTTSQACFRRVQAGQTPGFPRCKGRFRFHSFTCKEYGNGARLENGSVVLSKLGRLGVRWSRPPEGTPKTVTISREADGWSAAISCAEVPMQPLARTGEATGSALGLESFATLADGAQIANARSFRVAERTLKRAQRRVSRRKQGSTRRRTAVRRLTRVQQRVRRARADFHHKSALALVRQYDTSYHEDLQTAHLVRTHHLAQSIADAGWSAFLSILSCTAAAAGKPVVAVPPAYTAQACSGCGVLVAQGVSVRWHACPDGGTSLHRDQNAARTILRVGTQRSGAGQAPQARTQPVGAYVA